MENYPRLMSISTAHLKSRTKAWLNDKLVGARHRTEPTAILGGQTFLGWFVYADEEAHKAINEGELYKDSIPTDLAQCMVYARANGCEYIHFDCEFCVQKDLPNWEENESPA